MHRGPGTGSVSEAAAQYGCQHGIGVIDGWLPCSSTMSPTKATWICGWARVAAGDPQVWEVVRRVRV